MKTQEISMLFGSHVAIPKAMILKPQTPAERKPFRKLGHPIRRAGANGRLRIKSAPNGR